MTDQEILIPAALAAGRDPLCWSRQIHGDRAWDPLNDDGDALRLAASLLMSVDIQLTAVVIHWAAPMVKDCRERIVVRIEVPIYTIGYGVAVRLAIVRAAAEIGKENQ